MDLNADPPCRLRLSVGWLPRGAMDLNVDTRNERKRPGALAPSWSHGSKFSVFDRNSVISALAPSWSHGSKSVTLTRLIRENRWLPRGAMDLNVSAVSAFVSAVWLAPSWSHGSKS